MTENRKGLIGRCGLYCEACLIYGVSHRTEDVFARKRLKMAEHFDCEPGQIACEGCQQLTDSCWGVDCEILKCLSARGSGYCDDIDDCEEFGELDGRYGGLKDSMARLKDIYRAGRVARRAAREDELLEMRRRVISRIR